MITILTDKRLASLETATVGALHLTAVGHHNRIDKADGFARKLTLNALS